MLKNGYYGNMCVYNNVVKKFSFFRGGTTKLKSELITTNYHFRIHFDKFFAMVAMVTLKMLKMAVPVHYFN